MAIPVKYQVFELQRKMSNGSEDTFLPLGWALSTKAAVFIQQQVVGIDEGVPRNTPSNTVVEENQTNFNDLKDVLRQ